MMILPDPCYVLVYTAGAAADLAGDMGPWHFATADEAASHATQYETPALGTPTPQQRPTPCVVLHCGGCGEAADEGEESILWHFPSQEEAAAHAEWANWRTDPTPRCPACIAAAQPDTHGGGGGGRG